MRSGGKGKYENQKAEEDEGEEGLRHSSGARG